MRSRANDAVRQRGWGWAVEVVRIDLGSGAKQEFEPFLARPDDLVDPRVDRLFDQREQHGQLGIGPAGAELPDPRADPVDPAHALLELGGIPGQVVVDDAAAGTMEVQALLQGRRYLHARARPESRRQARWRVPADCLRTRLRRPLLALPRGPHVDQRRDECRAHRDLVPTLQP
jgi:hypothetical protein